MREEQICEKCNRICCLVLSILGYLPLVSLMSFHVCKFLVNKLSDTAVSFGKTVINSKAELEYRAAL